MTYLLATVAADRTLPFALVDQFVEPDRVLIPFDNFEPERLNTAT